MLLYFSDGNTEWQMDGSACAASVSLGQVVPPTATVLSPPALNMPSLLAQIDSEGHTHHQERGSLLRSGASGPPESVVDILPPPPLPFVSAGPRQHYALASRLDIT